MFRRQGEQFYEEKPETLVHRPDPLAIEQALALSHLHAAEFALIPALVSPDKVQLPPAAPVQVDLQAARLGLLKGDCCLIIWTHAAAGTGLASLSATDIAVFGGDVSKSTRLRPDFAFETAEVADLTDLAALLSSVHQDSHWRLAQRVADTGVLGLQGLLWALKRSVIGPDPIHSIPEDVRGFGGAIA